MKAEFGRWNLFVSLGLDANDVTGIGGFLYQHIHRQLQQINHKLEKLRHDYEEAFRGSQMYSNMLTRATNEAQRYQMKAEWSNHQYRMERIKIEADELTHAGEGLASLFAYMIEFYDRKLPEVFQEIFDPSLANIPAQMVDDSPAGFRLAYKRGGTDIWRFIFNQEQFIEVLSDFFVSAEQEIIDIKPQLTPWIGECSTALIHYIQSSEFIQGALHRASTNSMIKSNYKLPWEYISGGTMDALLLSYCERNRPFTTLEASVRNSQDLLEFLLNCRSKSTHAPSLCIASPTHAFLLEPGLIAEDPSFQIEAMRLFWSNQKVSEEHALYLLNLYAQRSSEEMRYLFVNKLKFFTFPLSIQEFRDFLIYEQKESEDVVDSFLHESIPVLSGADCAHLASLIAAPLGQIDFSAQLFWTPNALREAIKQAYIKSLSGPLTSIDIDHVIVDLLRKHQCCLPEPVFFGDTNWTAGHFALVIDPSGVLTVGCFERTALSGIYLHSWFTNQCEGRWVCYNNPDEYIYRNLKI